MRSHTVVLALVLCVACAMADDKSALKAVSESTDHFATNFFKAVASENKNNNLISSPLSAHIVLSMAAYGAGGNTATQMRTTLNLPTEDSVGRQGFQSLMNELNNVKNVTLEVANKMYVAKDLELKSEFKELTSGPFRSGVDPLDTKNPVDATKTINNWVDERTHHKISKILNDGDLTSDTRMLLLNAVYFKGKWANAFNMNNTEKKPFYYMENKEKKQMNVDTMYRHGDYVFGELPDLKAKFVELPYQNADLKMVIIVPDEIDGLSKIEENLEAFNHSYLAKNGYEREIHLFLPRFKIESTIDLQPTLEKLGMTDMFTDRANFTGITNEPLKVGKVRQKAFIEVNEEGSEAAAVTVAQIKTRKGHRNPTEMIVDRPFFFVIRDNKNNISLFQGHVSQL